MKKLTLLFGLALVVAIAGPATKARAVATCAASGTSVVGFTSCQIGDKLFTETSTTLSSAVTLDFSNPGGGNTYILTVDFGTGQTNFTGQFVYTVQVTDPSKFIQSVDLDTTMSPTTGGSTVTKQLSGTAFSTTLTSTNGSTASVSGLDQTLLNVTEDFTAVNGQFIITAANSYTEGQRSVPEPSSMLLFGAGLIGLAAWSRRRVKKN